MSVCIGDYVERFGLDFEVQYQAALIRCELLDEVPVWSDDAARAVTAASVWLATQRMISLEALSVFAGVDWSAVLTVAGVSY